MTTVSTNQYQTLAHWIELFDKLERQAVQEGLTESQVLTMAFESIIPGSDNEHHLSNLLLAAVGRSSFFSETTKLHFRNLTWENNQTLIMGALSNYVKLYKCLPNINTLADAAKLSRQTVTKHLKVFKQAPGYHLEQQQLYMMRTELLANVLSIAMNGSLKAAKIYLDATSCDTEPTAASANYIQINNMKIDQLTFTKLPEPVQKQISELIQVSIQQASSEYTEVIIHQKVDKT